MPIRIDRFDLWKNGAHALWIGGGNVVIATARGEGGERPWGVNPERRKEKYKKP